MFRELFNRVAAVPQYSGVAIDIGNRLLGHRGGHEAGVVEPHARNGLREIVSGDTAVLDRNLEGLTAAIVGHGN